MTILLDKNNKYRSMSSGGFVDKTLNTVEYSGEVPETKEGQIHEWDDENKELVVIEKAV